MTYNMQNAAEKEDPSSSSVTNKEQSTVDHVDSFQEIGNDADTILYSHTCINNDKDDSKQTQVVGDYVSKKPKWWKRIAGRRGTPGQRKAISRMTERGYVLSSSKLLAGKYRQQLSISKLFANRPNGKPIYLEDILIPHEDESHQSIDDKSSQTIDCQCLDDRYVCLEIGFGQGDVLLANASKFLNRYYIGSEIHQPGIGSALLRIETAINQEMTSLAINDETRTHPYENVRIYPGDGVKLIDMLPRMSLNAVYLTFPDPWPKEDDHCWRVIQDESVRSIGRVLKPGGCFYLATDSTCFYDWTMEIFQRAQSDRRCENLGDGPKTSIVQWEKVLPCPNRDDWLPVVSKYEEKGIVEGRNTMLQCWMRR